VDRGNGAWQVSVSPSLHGLDQAWECLRTPWGPPTGQLLWARAWLEVFGHEYELAVGTAARHGTPEALVPLVRRRDGGSASYELLGVHELWEPTDALYRDPEAVRAVLAAIVGRGGSVSLKRVPARSPLVDAAVSAAHGRAVLVRYHMDGCPYIVLDEGWAEPEREFSPRRRSDFRRARRTAERDGPVSVEILRPTPGELPDLLRVAFDVEAAGWKGRGASSILDRPRLQAFYRCYAEAAAAAGILRLCFLRIGDAAAAMQVGVEWADRFWLLKMGYDERFARCSPGNLLLLHTVGAAARAGLRSFEFFGTAQPWTTVWTQLVRPLTGVRVYRRSVSGLRLAATDAARAARRRAFSQDVRA
jgi:CelD/BcsL family acetyltransferase involved in cellulose biosynthesis